MEQRTLFDIERTEKDICAGRHGGADTSVQADKRVRKDKDRQLILCYIRAAGSFGMTLDELSIVLEKEQSRISGRVTELRTVYPPSIVDSGKRRKTRSGSMARVYVAL